MDYTNVFNQDYINIALQPIVYPRFKVEILDANENAIAEIINEISADSSGSISINYQQGVRRSCTLTLIDSNGVFLPNSENKYFWINRKFKVYTGLAFNRNMLNAINLKHATQEEDVLLHEDTEEDIILVGTEVSELTDTYWFSQGVFYLTNLSANRDFSNKTVVINGVDKFGLLSSELGYNQLEGTYAVPAGTNIYSTIRNILSLDKGNGEVLDPIIPLLDPIYIDEILPYDINKSPGSYLGDILKETANVLGCDIFYDVDGRLNLVSGMLDIGYSQKATTWEFSDVLREYSGTGIDYDFTSAINVVKVMADNINDKIIQHTAENNNPASSTRIELIGKKVLPLINSSYIYNSARAKDYAEYILNIESIIQTIINFNSSFLPHLDVNTIVGITDEYFEYIQQRFIVKSLNIPLSTKALISVSASNTAELPYFEGA